jgi:hypothetical protein
MLGQRGQDLVSEFSGTTPPVELAQEDAAFFADFVVDRTSELAASLDQGDLLTDLARFERLRGRAFRCATRPFDTPPAARWRLDDEFDADRPIRLSRSAAVAHFDWDLRQARSYSPEAMAALRQDPCDLIFFHNGTPDGIRIVRLGGATAAAVYAVSEASDGTTPRAACANLAPAAGPEAVRTLARLLSDGAMEWA